MKIFTKAILVGLFLGQVVCGMNNEHFYCQKALKNLPAMKDKNPQEALEGLPEMKDKNPCYYDGGEANPYVNPLPTKKDKDTYCYDSGEVNPYVNQESPLEFYNVGNYGYNATRVFVAVLNNNMMYLARFLGNFKNINIDAGCNGAWIVFYKGNPVKGDVQECVSCFSPLHLAVIKKNKQVIEILMKAGANPNIKGCGFIEKRTFVNMITPYEMAFEFYEEAQQSVKKNKKNVKALNKLSLWEEILNLLERDYPKCGKCLKCTSCGKNKPIKDIEDMIN